MQLWEARSQAVTEQDYLLLAGLYKNMGKLGDNAECLEKALVLLKKGKGPAALALRWTLQLTAMKSSLKK
jgi:hypothetical protein